MSQERLWAPWRLAYVAGGETPQRGPDPAPQWLEGAEPTCFLCRAVAESHDRENLVVGRGRSTISVLNRYPYNNGHLLVAPSRHIARLEELPVETRLECLDVLAGYIAQIERLMSAQGFNIGLNLGAAAGAGVPGHLHWHLVPRWNGDTNFMPVVAQTKVIPQSLDALWEMMRCGKS